MKTYVVVGLGYVGLGLATALSEKNRVLGYDNDENRIQGLRKYIDRNGLIETAELANTNLSFTHRIEDIKQANFYIVAVSTPAYFYEIPDLDPLIHATNKLASVIKKGDIIVFESTVYPGTTTTICIPILEEISRLTCGKDFNVGYSPERINPGDKHHTLRNITKIISAQNEETLNEIKATYQTICDRVYVVSSIAAAEAVKILENTQRDVNIALMNEFTKIMHAFNLDTHEIIEGAKTKWSFMPYKPGFVGGHCISIDPHYLAFEAKRYGVSPELILAARKVNDGMTQFVITSMMKLILKNKMDTTKLSIGIFGITYKENVIDVRNSLALKLVKELRESGFDCRIHDPFQHKNLHQVSLECFDDLSDLSVAIIAVGHDFYRELGIDKILSKCQKNPIVMDIPNLFIDAHQQSKSFTYWRM